MPMDTGLMFGVVGIVATVVASHVRLAGKQETFAAKVEERLQAAAASRAQLRAAVESIERKVSNGHFVRRDECDRRHPRGD